MSDEEIREPSPDRRIEESGEEEEEVDDLFGDDDDEEQPSTKQQNDDKSDEEDEEEEEDETELKAIDISLPRHSIASKAEETVYSIKMPVFLNVEAIPFDPSEFKDQVKQNAEKRGKLDLSAKQINDDVVAEKLVNQNTVRWRYSNKNDEIIKQSNAHFVQWDDGSISLKIGEEMFDFRELPATDNFLVRSHDQLEFLQNDSYINKFSNLVPTSTNSATHRNLTQAVKNIQKKDKILSALTEKDPLSKQRDADENERKLSKMKRQLELKRRLQEERIERNSPAAGGADRYDNEPAYERFERTYGNDYEDEEDDDDDGFIDNDEEEEEEEEDDDDEDEREAAAAERLRKLKQEGSSKYSKQDHDEEDDNKSSRKKRRIIDSDEDDE